ncbi:hypothetical protein [Cupriavidus sp. AcVe19-6a]|uniref:DUF7736 domain-containing protein n=1 Tax=Cupriavidus sp. AcVe19-6a TaxID=2821358 RepID=UPI001AE1D0A2|nr:hypothetical protein [Cupriavidus sp. AcVe19-6a]MBP0634885.1 hypothetical protein [Cupriavidus sp. AcVe19-6a]
MTTLELGNAVMELEPLSLPQAIVISAYTGVLCCPMGELHRAIELALGRTVFAYELQECGDEIRRAFQSAFYALCVEGEE